MTLMGDEPEMGLGDSGEHVQQLQDRLRGLQLLQDQPDGTFGDSTEQALREFQQSRGLEADGRMSPETWQALDQHMLQNGLQYNHNAGPGNQHWDQQDWNQDQQDPWGQGHEGQEHEGQEHEGHEHEGHEGQGYAADGQAPTVSPDGAWLWDGQAWQPNPAAPAPATDGTAAPAAAEAPVIPHIDNIHPNIAQDERFSSFHDFLRENAAQ